MAEKSAVTAGRFTRKTEPPADMTHVCITWLFAKKGQVRVHNHFSWVRWKHGSSWESTGPVVHHIPESGYQVGDKIHEGEENECVLEEIFFSP